MRASEWRMACWTCSSRPKSGISGSFATNTLSLPVEYYNKIPAQPRVSLVLLVDPMLATGPAVHACQILKAAGVLRLKFITHRRSRRDCG